MQSVPIFLQDAAGFFLIEIQYYSSVSCLDAVIEVMDDVWFLGFVDIGSVPSISTTSKPSSSRGASSWMTRIEKNR